MRLLKHVLFASLALAFVLPGVAQAKPLDQPPVRTALVITKTVTVSCNVQVKAGSIYNVTVHGGPAAGVFVEAGCPQDTTWNVKSDRDCAHIHAGSGGTVKVPLRITIHCTWTGRFQAVHQDGVQAMGGMHIRCINCTTGGILSAGSNGAFFFSEGSGGHERPTDIICDHCTLVSNNTGAVIGNSVDSGVTNSTLQGKNGCFRVLTKDKAHKKAAVNPIGLGKDANNVCLKAGK